MILKLFTKSKLKFIKLASVTVIKKSTHNIHNLKIEQVAGA